MRPPPYLPEHRMRGGIPVYPHDREKLQQCKNPIDHALLVSKDFESTSTFYPLVLLSAFAIEKAGVSSACTFGTVSLSLQSLSISMPTDVALMVGIEPTGKHVNSVPQLPIVAPSDRF